MVWLREGVSCERVGDSWLVLGDRDGVVHNLTGPAATVIDCVTTGQPIPPECDDAVASLVEAGVLTAPTGWSRRKVLAAGGAAAAVGMVTLTLPTAAMASSLGPFGTVTATPGDSQVTINWTGVDGTTYRVVFKETNAAGDFATFNAAGEPYTTGPVDVTGLTNGTGYSFKVEVVGSSVESAVVTATPAPAPDPNLGVTWTAAAATEANPWSSVAHGNGVWVAVAGIGTNQVMRSTNNGETWNNTGITGVTANFWFSVATNGTGDWVAVSEESNRVMYSSNNGVTWGEGTAPSVGNWFSVATNGTGVWVAVSSSGANRVMRSIDNGANWTAVAAAEANPWISVAYGNGVWVAVANDGTNQVMRSTDNGETWTAVPAASAEDWRSVATNGNGVWVAVARNGTSRVMRSTDNGLTWINTGITGVVDNSWNSVAYGNGVWVTVAFNGANRVMTSPDGQTWTARTAAEANDWSSVAFGNNRFVAVANGGTGNRVMYSPSPA